MRRWEQEEDPVEPASAASDRVVRPRRRLVPRLGDDQALVARTIWRLVRPHWKLALLAFLASAGAAAFEGSTMTVFAVALQAVFGGVRTTFAKVLGPIGVLADWALGQLDREGMFLALILLAVVMVILRSTLQFGASVASATLQVRVFKDVWNGIFQQFMRMSFAQVSRYKAGDLNQYVWDAQAMYSLLSQLTLLLGNLLVMAVYVALLLWLSWPLTLAALVGIGLVSRFAGGVIRRVRASAEAFLPARVEMGARSLELLSGMRLVRTFAREQFAVEHMRSAVDEAMRQTWRRVTWLAVIPPAMDSVTVLGLAVFLVAGYVLFAGSGAVFLPRLLTFLFILYRLMPLVGNLNQSRAQLVDLFPVVRRVNNMLRTDDKEYTRSGGRPFLGLRRTIEFRGVSLRYIEGEQQAVNDVTFAIPRGGFTAIVGESGAGKSTVADLLLRLYDPTQGQILVDGVDLRELDLTQWRSAIGVVSQDTFIFNASIRDNIAFGRLDAAEGEIVAAARAAHAHGFISELAHGYDTVVGDRGYRLSGGQRQRLAIARAVLRDPEILILDEATSDLDSHSERLIQQALEELRADRTVLAIAHRLSTIAMADRIIVLESGRMVEQGTHDELVAMHGRYAHFWRLQSESSPTSGTSRAAVKGGGA